MLLIEGCGGGVPQKGNEWSNKKGKKNRSVKVHGGEVKQSPFSEADKRAWRGYGAARHCG